MIQLASSLLRDITRKPVDMVKECSWVVMAKANIIGQAVTEGLQNSVHELEKGNLTSAWQAAVQSAYRGMEASLEVDAATSETASRSMGMLCVFLFIVACWSLELFLTRRVDPRAPAAEDLRERQKRGPQGAHFFHALSFARFLMAWHFVMSNYYQSGIGGLGGGGTWGLLASWGAMAGPWFYLVSGFCHSYQQLVSEKPDEQEDWFYGMARRAAPWYPLFALSLIYCAVNLGSVDAEDWAHFLGSLLLVDGLIWEEPGFPYLHGCQWLSFLAVYLLLWGPMHQVLVNSTNSVIWTLFTIAFLVVIPSVIMEWYFMGEWTLFVLIQYWPTFIFGQALATWLVRNCMQQRPVGASVASGWVAEDAWVLRPVHEIPNTVRFGATLGMATLGLMYFCFSLKDDVPLFRRPVAPLLLKGCLLPLLGLLTAGLACEVDPVAKLFARAPFRWAGRVTFMTFILQDPVHEAVEAWTGWEGLTWTYSTCLLVTSILGHVLLERPWCWLLGAGVR